MGIDIEFLDQISKKMGNSFYVFSGQTFKDNYAKFSGHLKSAYKKSYVAYAMKANYMPEIIRGLSHIRGMTEAVSRFEYDVARMFLDGRDIIFNGPVKTESDIEKALSDGSTVNIDSWYQIEAIRNLSGSFSSIDLGVRYNSSEVFPDCRFGFNYENGDLALAVAILRKIGNVKITSLHSHYSSSDKSPEFFETRARKSIEIHRVLDLADIQAINLGGGFMGSLPEVLLKQFGGTHYSFEDYANVLGRCFKDAYGDSGPRLIVEPGVSLVGDAMKLVAKVLETKIMHGRFYAVLDTSINVLNPTRSKVIPSCTSVSRGECLGAEGEYTLVGNTCMEIDVLVRRFKGQVSVGDFIVFDNRGAYSNNFTPAFIMPPPGIVTTEGVMIKRPDDMKSILSTYF